MTSIDPWAPYRKLLEESMQQAAEGVALSHGELLREQLEARREVELELPALLCLRVAESLGGSAGAALPGATALALLTQMAAVFSSLESQNGGPSLSTAWGMPRTLNAGDAFFALAQESLLATSEEITAEHRLAAAATLDEAVRGFAEALHAGAGRPDGREAGVQALFPAAAVLGGLLSGCDLETSVALRDFGGRFLAMTAAEREQALEAGVRAWLVSGG